MGYSSNMTKVLITGAAGFIGHHLVQYLLEKTDYEIVSLDRLDISGDLNRIKDILTPETQSRFRQVWGDLKAPVNAGVAARLGDVNYIIHLAASTHVDRSIEDPLLFYQDNVIGTANLIQYAKTLPNLQLFINFSTDEVFGPAPDGYAHKETDPFRPSNPYSASKAGAVMAGYASFITDKLPIITTFTMNNFGERQHPEKLVPKTIRSVINGTPMPIFAKLNENNELEAVGSRFWIHCRNTASAIYFLLTKGVPGESYNIIGFDELSNLDIAKKVAEIVGKPLIPHFVDFHKTRPGHDRRYALDGTKMRDLGWEPEVSFDESLRHTVEFSLAHPEWQ